MKTLSRDALFIASRQEIIDAHLKLQEQHQKVLSQVEELQFQLDWLKRQVFGSKSERFNPDDDLQTALDLGIDPSDVENSDQEHINYSRRKKSSADKKTGHGRGSMPTHLPIIDKVIEPQEDVSDLIRIGEEVSWYYDMEPASLHIVRITRPKYVRPNGDGIVTAALPPLPVDKGNAGAGLMTQVVIDKYVYHIPLDRQRKKFKQEYDVDFSPSWLSDLVKNVGLRIGPLYDAYVERLPRSDYLCADETPIPVLTQDKRGKTHRGYFWVYYDPLGKIVIFDYRKSRSHNGPSEFLKEFKGILQVDGYDGYNDIIMRNGILRAACMDHVRRKFKQALSNDGKRATYALDIMKSWYEVEAYAKKHGLSHEQRFKRRVAETVPSMKNFEAWLRAQVIEVLPKSAIGMAVSYALNQWAFFKPFMTDPRVELSNIATENKIRPVAIGRKNYLFKGSHEAAQRGAVIYSLATIAQNYSINPFVYFKEILTELPKMKNDEFEKLLLPEWKPSACDIDNL